jgi:hypothetical protein
MTSFLFKEFLSFFKRSVPCGISLSNHHLLALDGHGSRDSLEVIKQAQQQPLNVNYFKPFKMAFKKEKNNSMVRNNYNEPNKATLAMWVDKALDIALSKKNIKSGFKVIGIWPFNPKAMDGRTKPSEFYFVDCNNNTSYEDNQENSDEAINDAESWGENGTIA